MARSTRRIVLVAWAGLLPAFAACYEYRPLTTVPPAGETVALEITDNGRVNLSERFGPGLAEIQGRLVSTASNEYVLNVFRVSQISGQSAAWAGETTHLDRSYVGRVKGRTLSPTRTALMSVAGAVAVYFLVTRELTGSFTGGHEEPPGELPLSTRIPVLRARF